MCAIELKDKTLERVCPIDWDSPLVYDDYPQKHSQGNKIELDEDKCICIQGAPTTHTNNNAFSFQEMFSVDEWSFNSLELEHMQRYDFIGFVEFLSNSILIKLIYFGKLMESVLDPFWEDFVELEFVKGNKRNERVMFG